MASQQNSAKILFRKGYEQTGFSSSTTANELDVDATKIVRELIQNSVDAANETKRDKTKIRFEIESVSTTDCPGINEIKSAFYLALETQKKLTKEDTLSDIAQAIADRIKNALEQEHISLFCVLDNGVGLDEHSMRNILGDGFSSKGPTQGGSYGYGHLTVIPASDFRLVYYGGVTKNNSKMVASGHCILASFQDEQGRAKNKDGYFATDLKEDMFEPYVFPTNENIPDFIYLKIDWIKKQWRSGTVVLVPAFNFFREKDDQLWQKIEQAAVTNFLPLFINDKISVEFVRNGKTDILDGTSIQETLEKYQSEKNDPFLSGANAFKCFDVLKTGEDITFETESGNVKGKLKRNPGRGSQRIDLFRNGMWITHNGKSPFLPRLQKSTFSGYEAFHLVLLVNSEDSGDIHTLIRSAEPPLHNAVKAKQLVTKSKKDLEMAFEGIRDQLKNRLERIDTENFQLKGILSLPICGREQGGQAGIYAGEWKPYERQSRSTPGSESVHTGTEDESPGVRSGPGPGPRSKPDNSGGRETIKKPGTRVPFQAHSNHDRSSEMPNRDRSH